MAQTGHRGPAESGRTGGWTVAADWLARSLNEIDCSALSHAKELLAERTRREAMINERVSAVDGDQIEPDVVRLPDGSRVCWHLGKGRRLTRWVVEAAGEPCAYGRRS